jgi:hypothetical protein
MQPAQMSKIMNGRVARGTVDAANNDGTSHVNIQPVAREVIFEGRLRLVRVSLPKQHFAVTLYRNINPHLTEPILFLPAPWGPIRKIFSFPRAWR